MSNAKIAALIAFRDEEKHLPGFFSHLRDYVDGFIAIDDNSKDRSLDIAAAESKMLHLSERRIPSCDHHFEVENRHALLSAAFTKSCNWVLCGDADERFETRFLENLRELTDSGSSVIFGLKLVALCENLTQYRLSKSFKLVFFPCVAPQPYYGKNLLHQPWYPPALSTLPQQKLDYFLYHLGSLTREDRMARFKKFEALDPKHQHQPQGYDHLIDESKFIVKSIPEERRFRYE